jgi:hypothetical protein
MRYSFIIKDTEEYTYEIVPSGYDLLVENVNKMMKAGMSIQESAFDPIDEAKVKKGGYIKGYQYKVGLYDELINIYERKTQKDGKTERLKKW